MKTVSDIQNTTVRRIVLVAVLPVLVPAALVVEAYMGLRSFVSDVSIAVRDVWRG